MNEAKKHYSYRKDFFKRTICVIPTDATNKKILEEKSNVWGTRTISQLYSLTLTDKALMLRDKLKANLEKDNFIISDFQLIEDLSDGMGDSFSYSSRKKDYHKIGVGIRDGENYRTFCFFDVHNNIKIMKDYKNHTEKELKLNRQPYRPQIGFFVEYHE